MNAITVDCQTGKTSQRQMTVEQTAELQATAKSMLRQIELDEKRLERRQTVLAALRSGVNPSPKDILALLGDCTDCEDTEK